MAFSEEELISADQEALATRKDRQAMLDLARQLKLQKFLFLVSAVLFAATAIEVLYRILNEMALASTITPLLISSILILTTIAEIRRLKRGLPSV